MQCMPLFNPLAELLADIAEACSQHCPGRSVADEGGRQGDRPWQQGSAILTKAPLQWHAQPYAMRKRNRGGEHKPPQEAPRRASVASKRSSGER